jgi:hypothetical protein
MTLGYIALWLAAFTVTQLVEIPIYLRFSVPGRFWIAFGATGITHPVLWFVLIPAFRALASPQMAASESSFVWACEVSIVVVEALWMRHWGGKWPWAVALGANGASYLTGEVIWKLVPPAAVARVLAG